VSIENKILSNLIYNEPYARKVIPFLEPVYFQLQSDKVVFELITRHYVKYNTVPSKQSLQIDLDGKSLNEAAYKESKETIDMLDSNAIEPNSDWLVDQTEKFCQDKAVYNAVMKSIEILDGKDEKDTKTSIPDILSKALGVSFDQHVGHDFIEDAEDRFESYHRKEEKIEFDLDYMNKITNGGFSKKSLNVILAGTGAGKSLAMCHFAAHNLTQGLNVLYITMEMAEEAIAKRIDANLMNVSYNEIDMLPKDVYNKKMQQIQSKTKGRLVIKEYPTASAHSLHFKTLLKELELKKRFKPDIIYIDYINICASSRLRGAITANSYTIVKAIAEELRGLAVETNVPIITATQTNREGYSNSDVGLENTSESFGLPATADFMFALIRSDEMDQLGQVMIKQLKNRYNDPSLHRRFVLGIDKTKFKLFDAEPEAQDLQDDIPVMDYIEAARDKPAKTFGELKV
jgi:replicative DNA helicase